LGRLATNPLMTCRVPSGVKKRPAHARPKSGRIVNDLKPAAASPKIYAEPIAAEPAATDVPYPAVVRGFDVPFLHLVKFFLKAVFAAIPALILLTAILWLLGGLLQAFFPDLVKMKILIGFGG
jgi:hypothetical protein